jgi:hypothetical protein
MMFNRGNASPGFELEHKQPLACIKTVMPQMLNRGWNANGDNLITVPEGSLFNRPKVRTSLEDHRRKVRTAVETERDKAFNGERDANAVNAHWSAVSRIQAPHLKSDAAGGDQIPDEERDTRSRHKTARFLFIMNVTHIIERN